MNYLNHVWFIYYDLSNSFSFFSFFFSTCSDIIILISYKSNRGNVTANMVIISGVGVTIAAIIRIMIKAYRLVDFMNAGVITPTLDKIKITIGNSKTIPVPNDIVATEERYELIII